MPTIWLWWSLRVALGSHWGGFGVALYSQADGFVVALWWLCTPESMPSICLPYGFGGALGWLWGRIGVALGWLCTPKQMALWWPCGGFVLRSLCLVYAYHMALGWLWVACRPFLWTLDVRCPMFRTANRPGSQRVGMGLGVGPSGAFLPSWPLRTGTVSGPIQNLMQPCPAGSQAGIRLVFRSEEPTSEL